MEGNDFRNDLEFITACFDPKKFKPLNISNVLARVYSLKELRHLGSKLSIRDEIKNNTEQGRNVTYSYAAHMAKHISAKEIGDTLSSEEHSFNFAFVSYLSLPKKKIKSASHLLGILRENGYNLESSFIQIFNGITHPAGRVPRVESIKYEKTESAITILTSCTRVLMSPNSNSTAYENCFLCRIPALIKFIFERELIELTFPYFYEPLSGFMRVTGERPARFQELCGELINIVFNLTGEKFSIIDFEKFILHLELNCNAEDMGWQFEPQESASFDLKQNVIPLKKIFDSFNKNLDLECKALGKNNPLENVDLYHYFRALKEQGYTCQMVQSAPLGPRGGKVLLSLMNGERDSFPPILFLSDRSGSIYNNLQQEIQKSQEILISNPYKISNLLPKSKIYPPYIPYADIGLEATYGSVILNSIVDVITQKPNRALNVSKVAEMSQSTGSDVKKLFYYLLYEGFFKARFVAYHKNCNRPITKMMKSAFDLEFTLQEYTPCMVCNMEASKDQIETRMFFWYKEAHIDE